MLLKIFEIYLWIRVLLPPRVERASEAGQQHLGNQGIVDGEVGQSGAVR